MVVYCFYCFVILIKIYYFFYILQVKTMAVCFPMILIINNLKKVSSEIKRICGEIGSVYSSIEDHSVISSPNSTIDNLLLQNLTLLFNEYC